MKNTDTKTNKPKPINIEDLTPALRANLAKQYANLPISKPTAYSGSFSNFSLNKQKKILNIPYRSYYDSSWYGCREEFMRGVLYRPTGIKFLFTHAPNKRQNIIDFIERVEGQLKVPKEDCLIIFPTEANNVSGVIMSKWWAATQARKQMLTILVRVGSNYKKEEDNFNSTLDSHLYLRNTKSATQRFFDGYTANTVPLGPSYGWYEKFVGRSSSDVEKWLTK
jgi:hypothetical protein